MKNFVLSDSSLSKIKEDKWLYNYISFRYIIFNNDIK